MSDPTREDEIKRGRAWIEEARSVLILDHPFFGCRALEMEIIESQKVPAAATDYERIFINPLWAGRLNDPREIAGVLAHEIQHNNLKHNLRTTAEHEANRELWFEALDHAINLDLLASGFTLPEARHARPFFHDLAAEEIYRFLKEEQEKEADGEPEQNDEDQGSQNAPGGTNAAPGVPEEPDQSDDERAPHPADQDAPDVEPLDPSSPDWGDMVPITEEQRQQSQALTDEIAALLIDAQITQAAETAKCIGMGHTAAQGTAEESAKPILDWRELLREFVSRTAKTEYNWSRPHRKHLVHGFHLPSLHNEETRPLGVFVDTSGSVSRTERAHFQTEIEAIMEETGALIHIIYCDTKALYDGEYSQHNKPDWAGHTYGGGTSFDPPFQLAEELNLDIAAAIYLTDGCGKVHRAEPPYPVLWITTYAVDFAPWGEQVKLNVIGHLDTSWLVF